MEKNTKKVQFYFRRKKLMKNNTSDYITMMEILIGHFASFATKGEWSEEDREEWKVYQRFVSDSQVHLRSIKPPRAIRQERNYQHLLEETAQRAKEKETKLKKDFAKFSLKKSDSGNATEWLSRATEKMDGSRYGHLMDKYLN